MNPVYQSGNYLPYQPPPPPPQPPLPITNTTTNNYATTTSAQCMIAASTTAPYQYFNQAIPTSSGGVQGNQDQSADAYQYYDYYNYYGYGEQEYEEGYYQGDGKQKHYYCEICNVSCSGDDNYMAHLSGKIHKRKQQAVEVVQQTSRNTAFHCVICKVDCSSERIYQSHVSGQKHQKAIKGLIKENKPIPVDEVIYTPNVAVAGQKRKLTDGSHDSKLCPFGAENDEHMVQKLDQISLNKIQKQAIEQLVLLIEDTLFNVSRIIEEQQATNSETGIKNSANRLLRGIMRIGLLANNLLLKNDRRAHLTVLCSTIPTTDMLSQVTEIFGHLVKKGEKTLTHHGQISVTEIVTEAALLVSQAGIPMSICVYFTCSTIRQWSPGDLNYYSYNIPSNSLPQQACLQALSEMRRTKFYQVKCTQYEWINGVVKIVREFSNRIPAWSPLCDWIIILLVEKVFSLNKSEEQPGPSAALTALFKAISDGIILAPGSKLLDPCEKLPTDVLAAITSLERKQLFASARYSLRQINGNKMEKLLALEGPGIPSEVTLPVRKKPKQTGNNNDHLPNLSANEQMEMPVQGKGRGMPPGQFSSGANSVAIGTRSMRVYDNF